MLLHVETTGEMKAKTVGLREPGVTVKTGELLLAAVNECVFLEKIETRRTKRATVVQTPKHFDECVFRYTVLAEGLQEDNVMTALTKHLEIIMKLLIHLTLTMGLVKVSEHSGQWKSWMG